MENCNNDKSTLMLGALFAASNSAKGFKSYYDEIFERKKYQRIYIIKGGPGTGKSSFMRKVAEASEEKGYFVEYYYCSSDPESLDGIIIDDRIVMLDGTAPHVCEIKIAGARDEIINLGAFWDAEALRSKLDEIERLNKEKSAYYAKAYRFLAACGEVSDVNSELIFGCIKHSKMGSAITRLLLEFPDGAGAEIIPALCDSVGMKGNVRFDTYEKSAEKLYYIIDWYSSAHFYLSRLISEAQKKNMVLRVAYDPVCPQYPKCVYFCNEKVAFVISDGEDINCNRINMKRFLNSSAVSEVKKEMRYNCKLYEALLSSALDALSDAGKIHFELENIYSSCMDFSSKEKYTASFCEMLCGILKNSH